MKGIFFAIYSYKTFGRFSIFKIIPITNPSFGILTISKACFTILIEIIIFAIKNSILFPKYRLILVKTIGDSIYVLKSLCVACFGIIVAKLAIIIIPTDIVSYTFIIYMDIFVFKGFVFYHLSGFFIKIPSSLSCICKSFSLRSVLIIVVDIYPCAFVFWL